MRAAVTRPAALERDPKPHRQVAADQRRQAVGGGEAEVVVVDQGVALDETEPTPAPDRWAADEPLAAVLARGRVRLGDPAAVLEVEHDIVLTMSCLACDCTDVVNRPATSVSHAEARCPRCGADRQLTAVHVLEAPEQLALSAADFSLPANDVVTVRGESERVHFLVGASPFDAPPGPPHEL